MGGAEIGEGGVGDLLREVRGLECDTRECCIGNNSADARAEDNDEAGSTHCDRGLLQR